MFLITVYPSPANKELKAVVCKTSDDLHDFIDKEGCCVGLIYTIQTVDKKSFLEAFLNS